MKIVKKGSGAKGWSHKYKCTGRGNGNGGCGATLVVEEKDLYSTFSSSYDGSSDSYVTFKCAQCGVETDIEDYPPAKTHELPTKRAWQMQQNKEPSPPLEIVLSEADMQKLKEGGTVQQQIVSSTFKTPLIDLVIRTEPKN